MIIFRSKTIRIFTAGIFLLSLQLFWSQPLWAKLNVDRLAEKDIKHVEDLIKKLEPLIQSRQTQENLSTLTFPELYAGLDKNDRAFLKEFEKLDPKALDVKIPFRGIATGKEDLIVIKGQKTKMKDKDKEQTLPPQFLPKEVYDHYLKMMAAMEKDLGKRLYVESGYRSSAYQLYLFVFYLKNHDYSIRETKKFVALPGYSEHGSPTPENQAIDFINADGINGEDNAAEFDALPEYTWLLKNAHRFGFVLSYPKNAPSGITYEPWHWRYEKGKYQSAKK